MINQRPIRFLITLSIIIICIFIQLLSISAVAGVLYTQKQLLAAGTKWTQTAVLWRAEQSVHQQRMDQIKARKIPDQHKDMLYQKELGRHRKRSKVLAGRRDKIQNMLINETNARVKGGKTATSGDLRDTAGTKFGEEGHRGMYGDRDMGGGERTTKKMEDVLEEMGLYNSKNPKKSKLIVKKTADTFEIKGEFDLTVNKEGIRPKAGTAHHQVQVDGAARNPETYVSESMKTMTDGKLTKQQVGTEYVEIQDHRKKAIKGLRSDGKGLVNSPDSMQSMAKGTGKVLDMGRVDDDSLKKILARQGIKDSPAQFKRRLRNIKQSLTTVTDPKQAEAIRRASQEVFAAAEDAAFSQAKRDLVDLRRKAASMPTSDPARMKIEDEIADSVAKMKTTKAVNDDALKAPGPAQSKAVKVFGAVMILSDIGGSCQEVEKYMEGKQSLGDTVEVIADQYVTQGLIGSVKKGKQSYQDYQAAAKDIQAANKQNVKAYIIEWGKRFRKAGMSAKDVKKIVAAASLAGDVEMVERMGRILRAEGKEITSPELIVETFSADETTWDRTKAVGWGVLEGTYRNLSYFVKAPGRVVEAFGERELAEADLEYDRKTKDAFSRGRLFQKLVQSGIDFRRANRALNAYENDQTGPLRALFREARAKIEKARAEEAAAREVERKIAARAARLESLLRKYSACINYLRTTPLKLTCRPQPIELERQGDVELIELALMDKNDKWFRAEATLRKTMEQLTGAKDTVKIDYKFFVPGQEGSRPNVWLTNSPGVEGVYPVKAWVTVQIDEDKLPQVLGNLATDFTREEFATVEVAVAENAFDYAKGIWPELRKANRIEVNIGADLRTTIKAQPSGIMRLKYHRPASSNRYRQEGNILLVLGADGKSIVKMAVELTKYTKDNLPTFKQEFTFKKLILGSFTPETETEPIWAHYHLPKDVGDVWGTLKKTDYYADGKVSWTSKVMEIGPKDSKGQRHHSPSRPTIIFKMDEKTRMAKLDREYEHKRQKREADKAREKQAAGGLYFVGPMAKAEGFKGKIEIHIGKDFSSVHGKFKCNKSENRKGRETQAVLTGEFLGAINPETGKLEARFSKSHMGMLVKRNGRWGQSGAPRSLPKKARMIGQYDSKNKKLTGYIAMGGQKGFAWSAVHTDPKENKQ